MRRAAKRDANESAIVAALEAVGATVTRINAGGVPDLLVGHRGRTYLLEVKAPLGPRGGIGDGHLTDEQEEWWETWRGGRPVIVRTPAEALAAIGVMAVAP